MSDLPKPLSGMRVIELAHIMAGPLCGMMLADMGAEVIKVEKNRRRRRLKTDGATAGW